MLEKIFLSVPNLQFCKNNFCQENLRAKPLILEWNFYYRNLLIQENLRQYMHYQSSADKFCNSNKTSHLSVSTLSSSPLLNNVCYSYRSLISFYPSNILFRPKALVTQEQLLARISKNKNNYSHKKIGSHSSNSSPVQTTFVTATKTCQITPRPLHPPSIFVWYDTTSFFYIGRKFNSQNSTSFAHSNSSQTSDAYVARKRMLAYMHTLQVQLHVYQSATPTERIF